MGCGKVTFGGERVYLKTQNDKLGHSLDLYGGR